MQIAMLSDRLYRYYAHLCNVKHCSVNPTKEAAMSKKGKTVFALAEDFQAMIAMVPKLEVFIKVHKEIAAGYQKYRKSGGAAIPGIEKHFAIKEEKNTPVIKKKETAKAAGSKAPKEAASVKTDKKKIKK
jgi:hypothetical protein